MTDKQEHCADSTPSGSAPAHELSALDTDFIRVLEDLIDVWAQNSNVPFEPDTNVPFAWCWGRRRCSRMG